MARKHRGKPSDVRRRELELSGRGITHQLNRIYERDKGICQICQKPVRRDEASRDHIKDLALCTKEEARDDSNIQLAHIICNNMKHWPPNGKQRVIVPTRAKLHYTIAEVHPELLALREFLA